MASGLSNKLTGQIGEFLVCAELGRQLDLVATPFAGNVPAFDLLVADEQCRSIPIQVKTSRGDSWRSSADHWLHLTMNGNRQVGDGLRQIDIPSLIYVFVALAENKGGKDRFFILTKTDVQKVYGCGYTTWMQERNWIRPRKPDSFHCICTIGELEKFENNWGLVRQQLEAQSPPSLPLPLTPSL